MFLALVVYVTMVVLPAITAAGVVATVAIIVSTIAMGLPSLVSYGEDQKQYQKKWSEYVKSGWLKLLIAVAVVAALTPDEKTSWYILGAYAAEKVATADTTKELASGAYDIFRDLVKKAQENLGEVDAAAIKEKAGVAKKVVDSATKTVDDVLKQSKGKE